MGRIVSVSPAPVEPMRGAPAPLVVRVKQAAPTILAVGQKGDKGRDGTNGASTFVWPQVTPMAVWTVPHNLLRYPSVTVVDTLGRQIEADISYIDENIIQITHGAPYAGKAYIN